MLRAMDCFSEAVMLCDPSNPAWPILYANDAFVAATGVSRDAALEAPGLWSLFQTPPAAPNGSARTDGGVGRSGGHSGDVGPVTGEGKEVEGAAAGAAAARKEQGEGEEVQAARAAAAAQRTFRLRLAPRPGVGGAAAHEFEFKPSSTGQPLRDDIPAIGIPAFIESGALTAGAGAEGAEGARGAPAAAAAEGAAGAAAPRPPAAPPAFKFYFGVIRQPPPASIHPSSGSLEGSTNLSAPATPSPAAGHRLTTSSGYSIVSGGSTQAVAVGTSSSGSELGAAVPAFHELRPQVRGWIFPCLPCLSNVPVAGGLVGSPGRAAGRECPGGPRGGRGGQHPAAAPYALASAAAVPPVRGQHARQDLSTGFPSQSKPLSATSYAQKVLLGVDQRQEIRVCLRR